MQGGKAGPACARVVAFWGARLALGMPIPYNCYIVAGKQTEKADQYTVFTFPQTARLPKTFKAQQVIHAADPQSAVEQVVSQLEAIAENASLQKGTFDVAGFHW